MTTVCCSRMKSTRRIDAENVRRDSRDRDVSHTSSSSRFGRKRPSMLSEFHGSKHYRDSSRDGDRENTVQHHRPHSRYSHDASGGGTSSLDHTHSSLLSSGFHSKSKTESRSRHSHHHTKHRHTPSHHHHSNSHYHAPSLNEEEETPVKRPRLMETPKKSSETSSGGNAMVNSSGGQRGEPPATNNPWPLTYHLEDIDSDDDDSLLQEEKLSKSPTPVPASSSPTAPSSAPQAPSRPPQAPSESRKPQTPRGEGAAMPSKEELLMMMEKVDRDIVAAETQISALEKKRAELEESARTAASTPHSSTFSSLPSPTTPPSDQAPAAVSKDTPLQSPTPANRLSPKKSQMDIIYADNRIKSKSAQNILSSVSLSLPSLTPLYHQPSEAPCYYHNLLSHLVFRPKLVHHIRRRKLNKHKKELLLSEEYDTQMTKWEKSVERIENSQKKKLRDQKNRELFERCFPELKAKREHQERMTRVDQRGYGIVRSDAELKEIMYELCEQEEAPARYRKTHAIIPPMLTEAERRVKFFNTNGLVTDPMALHRDSRFAGAWSEEEKTIFRDKYTFYPKNFGVISSFLPNKTPADCVQFYYLSKKRDKFKHLVRKANLKRKKPFVKPSEFHSPLLSNSPIPPVPISIFASGKPKAEEAMSGDEDATTATTTTTGLPSEFGDWSLEEISNLKEGLRKYGRAWGKIYREVGGLKTATQCKQFYDTNCGNKQLDLLAPLAEHSSMKNAEKLRRRAESRKSAAAAAAAAAVASEVKRKTQQQQQQQQQHTKPVPPQQEAEEMDSENTASASETESNSDESSSESTITDSSPEDGSSSSAFLPPPSHHPGGAKSSRAKKPKSLPAVATSAGSFRRTSEDALDLFISAAEALNNIVPPEVALHDHTYALPPSSLVSTMDLQGTSGLSLIAAAAAVVSPTLSKSAASTKLPSLSPVRAPRGRPPNSQRKGTNTATSKLAPSLLSPAGTSPSVLLTDMKAAPLRGRARSAPSDRPKVSTLHIPRTGSNLARMSINSGGRGVVGGRGVPPGSSYSRHKAESGSSSSGKANASSSLKSMIAFHPVSHTTTTTTTSSSSSATNSTSAFEALVNVAVAAPPAELPQNTGPATTDSKSASSPASAPAFTATPLSRSQPAKDTVTIGMASSNSNASNSTTTAYIDVNQAINILASLANGNSQTIPLSNTRLFAQNPVSLLGSIVSQGAKSSGSPGTALISSSLPASKGGSGKALNVSATMDTLLGHLTSGISSQASSSSAGKTATGKSAAGSAKARKSATSKPEGSAGGSKSSSSSASRSSGSAAKTVASVSSAAATAMKAGIPQSIQLMGNVEDLSNLNLLSSLVAAVAGTQAAPSSTTSSSLQSTSCSEPTLTYSVKTSVGLPSNLHSTKTESKRSLESVVSALTNRHTGISPLTEATSSSSSYVTNHAHTPTSSDESAMSVEGKQQECERGEGGRLIAATSSIKRAPSGGGGSVYGMPTSCAGGGGGGGGGAGELPRSVVRTGLGTLAAQDPSESNSASAASENSDMTSSLASIIPPYNPSMSSQSSLLLYTRSLSFPLSVPAEPPTEEEDHLESATRGISELSKLLGTDNSTDTGSAASRNDCSVYKVSSNWNPADLLSTAPSSKGAEFGSGLADKSSGGKPFLSGLLESQIHGTVHHKSLASSKLTGSSANSSRSESMDNTVDLDPSR